MTKIIDFINKWQITIVIGAGIILSFISFYVHPDVSDNLLRTGLCVTAVGYLAGIIERA